MLIIDSTSKHSVKYNVINTKIRMVKDGDLYKLNINDIEYASSESFKEIQILYTRLMSYCERYKRKDDTFDIVRELKIIRKELSVGKFQDLEIGIDNLNTCVGYPTYTS